jgi:2'-5' RNA ligase
MGVARTDRLRYHWRPEVADYLTWHVLFDDQPALHSVGETLQQVLEGIEGIDVVPTRWLHLTVQGVGSVDDIAEDGVAALVGAAQQRLAELQPAELTFGPAEVQWEGVTLTAIPAESVAAVLRALRTAIADVFGADRVPGAQDEAWWPHVSLADASARVPAATVLEAIAERPVEPVTITIDHVSLIKLRRDGRCYVWSPVATVPIGSPMATG